MRRRFMAVQCGAVLVFCGALASVAGAASRGGERWPVALVLVGLSTAAAMPILLTVSHLHLVVDASDGATRRTSNRRITALVHLLSGAGVVLAAVGAAVSDSPALLVPVVVVLGGLATLLLVWTSRRVRVVAREDPVVVMSRGDRELLTRAGVRALRRRMVLVAAVVGVPLLVAFVVVCLALGWPGASVTVDVLALICLGSGFAALVPASRVGMLALRAPLAAVGGDGRRARRVARAVSRGLVDRLDPDDAATAVPWARATRAGSRLTGTTVGTLLLALGPLQVRNLLRPGEDWWPALAAATFLLLITALAFGTLVQGRRLRRFLSHVDPEWETT